MVKKYSLDSMEAAKIQKPICEQEVIEMNDVASQSLIKI